MGIIVTRSSINEIMKEIGDVIGEFQEELAKKVLAVLGMKIEFIGVPSEHRPDFLNDLTVEIREALENYILGEDVITEAEAKDNICLMIHEAGTYFIKEMSEAIYGEADDSCMDTNVEAFSDLEKKIGKILEEGLATEEGEEEE